MVLKSLFARTKLYSNDIRLKEHSSAAGPCRYRPILFADRRRRRRPSRREETSIRSTDWVIF